MKMQMMEMFFHFRIKEYILLKEWFPETFFAFVVSCFGIVLLSFSYEALKCIRALIFKSSNVDSGCCDAATTNQAIQERAHPATSQDPECDCGESTVDSTKALPQLPKLISLPFSPQFLKSETHWTQTFLYFIQIFISYSLMMIAMTYNVPLVGSMLLGHIIGYLFLGPLYEISDEQKLCDCCG
jgi:copper transporter 1